MTIEISLDDLMHLAEVAKTNGASVLYATRSTDGKRADLIITSQPRRKHHPAPPKAAPAKPPSAKAD